MKAVKKDTLFEIIGHGTFVERANHFLHLNHVRCHSAHTTKSYAYDLVKFGRWLDKITLPWSEDFNQKHLQDYLVACQSENQKPRTINRKLACIRVFYYFCFGQYIPHAAGVLYPKSRARRRRRDAHLGLFFPRRNHVNELKIKVPSRLIKPLLPGEVDGFLSDVKRYRDLSIILTMLLCGLRSCEIIELKLANVDFHRGQIKILGKGNKERIVPAPIKLLQIYEKYLHIERPQKSGDAFFVILQGKKTGQAMTSEGIRSLFRYRRKLKKVPNAKPHQFRHSFASELARVGTPLTTIQKLLGHSDPTTTEIYIKLFIEDIRKDYENAMKKIEVRYASLQN